MVRTNHQVVTLPSTSSQGEPNEPGRPPEKTNHQRRGRRSPALGPRHPCASLGLALGTKQAERNGRELGCPKLRSKRSRARHRNWLSCLITRPVQERNVRNDGEIRSSFRVWLADRLVSDMGAWTFFSLNTAITAGRWQIRRVKFSPVCEIYMAILSPIPTKGMPTITKRYYGF